MSAVSWRPVRRRSLPSPYAAMCSRCRMPSFSIAFLIISYPPLPLVDLVLNRRNMLATHVTCKQLIRSQLHVRYDFFFVPVVSVRTSAVPVSLQSHMRMYGCHKSRAMQDGNVIQTRNICGKERNGHRDGLGVEGDDDTGNLSDPLPPTNRGKKNVRTHVSLAARRCIISVTHLQPDTSQEGQGSGSPQECSAPPRSRRRPRPRRKGQPGTPTVQARKKKSAEIVEAAASIVSASYIMQ
jgi:hypothetical protein